MPRPSPQTPPDSLEPHQRSPQAWMREGHSKVAQAPRETRPYIVLPARLSHLQHEAKKAFPFAMVVVETGADPKW